MSTYIIAVAIAIPFFMLLISIEWIVSIRKGIIVNNPADMISSLSSGLSNILKDGLKISIALISYSWLVDYISIFKFESLIISVIIAFIVKDFAGYWLHRMDHRVNILWNRHLIHHSSEEFNLACALRQSISGIISFGAIFMIPAALFGVPAWLFAILGPIHLFMQFWYHTRLINKMGVLEHILVTPSHHRVHHAINPEYLDKNFSQIFIIWDKIFGTFQEELTAIPPVYGILRPAKTWNPIRINFKHFFSLLKDAIQTKNWTEKIKLWFMPTGYRPTDVQKKNPIKTTENPNNLIKYKTENTFLQFGWGYFNLIFSLGMIFHLFYVENQFEPVYLFLYAGIILSNIFSLTSLLDNQKIMYISELIKLLLLSIILWNLNLQWFNLSEGLSFTFIGLHFIIFWINYKLLN